MGVWPSEAGPPSQFVLPDGDPVSAYYQEGGTTLASGDFTPSRSTVMAEIEVSATVEGWGGLLLFFDIGVLPESPPANWEGGTKNRISKGNSSADEPLTGVTEYQHFGLGFMTPNKVATSARRRIVLTGLTPGQEYAWEIRAVGISYYKELDFPTNSEPRYACYSLDEQYAWVACSGDSKLRLMQLGYSPYWNLQGDSPREAIVAEVDLPGIPGAPAEQPTTGDYVAVVDSADNLNIIDTDTLTIVGSYKPAGSPALVGTYCVWDSTGVWVGTESTGTMHHFNISTLAFDESIVVGDGSGYILLFGPVVGDMMWIAEAVGNGLYRVNLGTGAEGSIVHTPGDVPHAMQMANGNLAFIDTTNDRLRVITPAGATVGTVTLTARTGAHGWVALTEDDNRSYFVNNHAIGWAWMGSFNVINDLSTTTLYGAQETLGSVVLTTNEGALFCRPDNDSVDQWPGSRMDIRPALSADPAFGGEFITVTFEGATYSAP